MSFAWPLTVVVDCCLPALPFRGFSLGAGIDVDGGVGPFQGLFASIALSNPSFATRYPSSRPRFIPNFLPCFIPNFSPSSNARIQGSLRFSPSLVVEAQLHNWAMLLRSAISRKPRKSQADVDLDAVLVFPSVGDTSLD